MNPASQSGLQLSTRVPMFLFAIWLLWSVAMLAFSLRSGDAVMSDPDDFMRMVQVRDWMSGQNWFDVTQYRINPPEGGLMHWSRMVDVPIAGMIWLGSLFLPLPVAEYVAILSIPLLLLGLLMALLFRTTRGLADEKVALVAAALLPTFPLVLRQFLPGRIDHHSWQILMAALAMFALFDRNQRRGAYLMAFALAFWMHVSIEGLPYVAIFGAILAAFYVFPKTCGDCEADNRLIHFTNGLALFSAGFWIATQAPANLATAHCDAVSWPLVATLLLVSVGLNLFHHGVKPAAIAPRLAMLGVVAAAGAAMFIGTSDSCVLDPFGQLTPLVREFWHETISEGLPIHRQAAPIISLLLFVPMLVGAWIIAVLRSNTAAAVRKQWLTLAALVLLATLLSFKVQRTAGVAEVFALPAIAALIVLVVQRIGKSASLLIRVFGTVGAIMALSPITAFIVGDALFAAPEKRDLTSTSKAKKRACDLARLNSLPRGLIFTTMAAGPETLYRTGHSVYVSGYHRNNTAMNRLIATMLGSADDAYEMLREMKADYVVFCSTHFEAQSYLKDRKASFARTLMAKTQPAWLKPVPEFAQGEMRVYRVALEPRGK